MSRESQRVNEREGTAMIELLVCAECVLNAALALYIHIKYYALYAGTKC